jgi:tetratricopeptide (TPR) repeat protein
MNPQADSLKLAIIKRLERDAFDELRALVDQAEKNVANVQIDDLERRALLLIDGHGFTSELFDTISHVVQIFYLSANSERGLYIAERLRVRTEISGYGASELSLSILNIIGICATDVADYIRAIDVFNVGVNLAKELNNSIYQAKMLVNLSVVWMDCGLYAEALEKCYQLLQFAKHNPVSSVSLLFKYYFMSLPTWSILRSGFLYSRNPQSTGPAITA